MIAASNQPVVVICCSVFRAEVLALMEHNWPDLAIRFLSSMLHMKPDKLTIQLETRVEEEILQGHKVLLIYGDCCMRMAALTEKPGIVRVRGNNCCALLLGNDAYHRLSHEGAFFLFPEWAHRWRHIFSVELGLNPANAAALMGDMHRKLIYLDTGVVPIPADELQECSQYCGLPWEVLKVSLETLRTAIQEALDKLNAMEDTA